MSRYLLLDVGAGTLDLLCYDDEAELHHKAVVRSPVRQLADRVTALPGNLVVTGGEMGGGPICRELERRASTDRVVMTRSAAATIHHDEERVRARGIEVVEQTQADELAERGAFSPLRLADLDTARIELIVSALDVPLSFDVVGVCLQDHGVPPAGGSHLELRHELLSARLDEDPNPAHLLMTPEQIPTMLNRCRSAAADAEALAATDVFVMDSGMAAIVGARTDPAARGKRRIVVLDVATSHTIAAAFDGPELASFVEYHTRDITTELLDQLIVDMTEGRADHAKILSEGGHGAYCRSPFPFEQVEAIIATGPKRDRIRDSRLPLIPGAPLGDNMMTGNAGLLEAIRSATRRRR